MGPFTRLLRSLTNLLSIGMYLSCLVADPSLALLSFLYLSCPFALLDISSKLMLASRLEIWLASCISYNCFTSFKVEGPPEPRFCSLFLYFGSYCVRYTACMFLVRCSTGESDVDLNLPMTTRSWSNAFVPCELGITLVAISSPLPTFKLSIVNSFDSNGLIEESMLTFITSMLCRPYSFVGYG